jgi:structural maintenance of chromosome 3 (chondroitin sulfate proteoglycan 6)
LAEVTKTISKKEAELEKLIPRFKELVSTETKLQNSMDACKLERETLISKQGRSSRFKTQRDRDAWLKEEIQSLKQSLVRQQENLKKLDQDCKESVGMYENGSEEIEQVKSQLASRRVNIERIQVECDEARLERNKLDEKRK